MQVVGHLLYMVSNVDAMRFVARGFTCVVRSCLPLAPLQWAPHFHPVAIGSSKDALVTFKIDTKDDRRSPLHNLWSLVCGDKVTHRMVNAEQTSILFNPRLAARRAAAGRIWDDETSIPTPLQVYRYSGDVISSLATDPTDRSHIAFTTSRGIREVNLLGSLYFRDRTPKGKAIAHEIVQRFVVFRGTIEDCSMRL